METPSTPAHPGSDHLVVAVRHRGRLNAGVPLAISAVVLLILLATGPGFGIAWDEGYTVRRDRLLDQWFQRVFAFAWAGHAGAAFTSSELDRYWLFSRQEPNGHPPFYALLGVAGWRISHRWLPPLQAYRFGPMLLTAVTVGLVYTHLAQRRGLIAGPVAAVLIILMPRSFAHAHYAHYDMPMTCMWLLAQIGFVASLTSRTWIIPFGLALGLAAATKFTGLFAVVPAVTWVALVEIVPWSARRANSRARALASTWPGLTALSLALPLALLTLYAIQPAWWVEPVAGPYRYFASNLTRAATQPLATLYLGKIYEFSLPWHNTLVLTAITTPVAVLVLGVIGTAACVSRARVEPWVLIWPLSWLTLMIVRALPNAPGHDGIRLFLPSLASLAVLAGLGAAWLVERFQTGWQRAMAFLLITAAVVECLVGIARIYPYTDSYYNVAIGSLAGADRLGFELTYYWETAGPEFLDWARAKARRKPIRLAFPMDATNHNLLREWGEIPPELQIVDLNEPPPGKPMRSDYFVLQRRRGFYYPSDRWLDHYGHPVFAIRREGVDLLRVFTVEEDREAAERTKHEPVPRYLRR